MVLVNLKEIVSSLSDCSKKGYASKAILLRLVGDTIFQYYTSALDPVPPHTYIRLLEFL